MGEVKQCPKCGNLQSRGKFCSQCGHDITNAKPFIEDYVSPAGVVRAEENDYGALRLVSGLFVAMGWGIIILTVVSACLVISAAAGAGSILVQGSGSVVPAFIGGYGVFGALIFSAMGISLGLGEIAAGQVIMVFLDIRDDVRKISKKQTTQ